MNICGSLQTRAKADNAQKRIKRRATENRGKRGQRRRRGDTRRRRRGAEGGSIGKGERKGKKICRVRAIPRKVRRKNKLRSRKTSVALRLHTRIRSHKVGFYHCSILSLSDDPQPGPTGRSTS